MLPFINKRYFPTIFTFSLDKGILHLLYLYITVAYHVVYSFCIVHCMSILIICGNLISSISRPNSKVKSISHGNLISSISRPNPKVKSVSVVTLSCQYQCNLSPFFEGRRNCCTRGWSHKRGTVVQGMVS